MAIWNSPELIILLCVNMFSWLVSYVYILSLSCHMELAGIIILLCVNTFSWLVSYKLSVAQDS